MKFASYSNRIGGFASVNTGEIRHCYSDAKIKHEGNVAGFVFENTGKIETSFAQKRTEGKENCGCFYVKNKGVVENSGFLRAEGKKKSADEKFVDKNMLLEYKKLEEIFDKFGLDGAWIRPSGSTETLSLNTELAVLDTNGKDVVEISSADQLMQIAASIAGGDADAASAHYKLTKNIKLGGKKWIPIGLSETNPFTGSFDGAGFTVSGFKIKSKGLEVAGFFGHVKGGAIANLTLDCVIDAKDGALTGGMCADNDGKIVNCHVVAKLAADRSCGGFVGKNAGEIERCSFVGKVSKPIPIILFFLPLIGLLLALLIIALILLSKRWGASPYVPEVIDPNQRPVIDHGTYDPPPAGSERISIEMNQEAYFNVKTQVGLIDFVNPKRGTRNLVVRIRISDAELLNKIGKTGRTEKEQAALEADPNYNPANSYQELFRSGLLEIGYALDAAKLSALPDGTTLPVGDYEMLVVVDAYDPETNEKSVMKTQLPITIHMVESAEKPQE